MRFTCPRFFEYATRYTARGVAKRECYHHNIVEGSNDGQELGDQVDRRQDPQTGEYERRLRAEWDVRVAAESPHRGGARGKYAGEILQHPGR